jgi:hypothetical protein
VPGYRVLADDELRGVADALVALVDALEVRDLVGRAKGKVAGGVVVELVGL